MKEMAKFVTKCVRPLQETQANSYHIIATAWLRTSENYLRRQHGFENVSKIMLAQYRSLLSSHSRFVR
jgi:hypothetical protein